MSSKNEKMIWLVGAGLGRTGTDSLCAALKELGYQPHHMHSFTKGSEEDTSVQNINQWYKLSTLTADELRNVDWDTILGRFNATADWPSAAYWEYIYDYYSQKLDDLKKSNSELPFPPSSLTSEPTIKVILTIRNNSEQWWRSVQKSIFQFVVENNRFFFKNVFLHLDRFVGKARVYSVVRMVNNTVWNESGFFENEFLDSAKSQRRYESYNRSVVDAMERKNASKQLFTFELGKHGYKELCQFLEISQNKIPKNANGDGIAAFPHTNTGREIQTKLNRFKYMNTFGNVTLSAIGVGVLTIAVRYFYPSFQLGSFFSSE